MKRTFISNRQWLESLSDDDFARYMYEEWVDSGFSFEGFSNWLKAEHKENE